MSAPILAALLIGFGCGFAACAYLFMIGCLGIEED